MPVERAGFAERLLAWQRKYGRHGLPWQVDDPYRVWVSEIMLQQTQVEVVLPFFLRFIARFPDVASLARAEEDAVLALWSGLGYYARGRNLHAAARMIDATHGGAFPREFEAILALPGVGRSTAAAIAAFCFGERRAILDGNVKRVLCRLFDVTGWPGDKAVEDRLWKLAESLLPAASPAPDGFPGRDPRMPAYTQGLMDLGALLCRRSNPDCGRCPFAGDCVAQRTGRQAELPAAKPHKPIRQKATAMLVLCEAGEVLLEKRPPTGVWGGMWSLPECSGVEAIGGHLLLLGCTGSAPQPLPDLLHRFSHFSLAITPWRVDVRRGGGVASPGHVWLPIAEAMTAAIPAPVRQILTQLALP
jgi:A/G-specific adenine glycosylase